MHFEFLIYCDVGHLIVDQLHNWMVKKETPIVLGIYLGLKNYPNKHALS